MLFQNRIEAGKKLSQALIEYKNVQDVIILALPRGGVIVADQVATILNLPLDLVIPRKIGAPGNPEYAIGAITEDGQGIFNEKELKFLDVSQEYLYSEIKKEKKEAQRRLEVYRGQRKPLDLKNKKVIIIDDGIATGLTMQAAIKSVRKKGAIEIIVAVPVSAKDSLEKIKSEVNKVICLNTPSFFGAIGAFYEEFSQTEDKEVIEIMKKYKENKND